MKRKQIYSSGLGMLIKTQITISVSFLKPVLKIGKQKTVEYADLGKPNAYLNPTELNDKFEVEWKKEKKKDPKKQSLLNACIRSTKPSLWIWSIVFYVTGLVINFFLFPLFTPNFFLPLVPSERLPFGLDTLV